MNQPSGCCMLAGLAVSKHSLGDEFSVTDLLSTLIDSVKVLRPTRHKISHFLRHSSQPISWLGTEETKSNTTNASNTRAK